MRAILFISSIACLLGACEEALPADNEINGPQVLGIRSDPVRLNPELPLGLEALFAGVDESDTVQSAWFVCNSYVVPSEELGMNECPLLTTPAVAPAIGSTARVDIDISSLLTTVGEGYWLCGISVLVLLCPGELTALPAAGESVDILSIHDYCGADEEATAVRWVAGAVCRDGIVRNPDFTISVNGELLPMDAPEIEVDLPCDESDCLSALNIELVVDPSDWAVSPDSQEPIRVNWYAGSGALDVYRQEAYEPEPFTATWALDAPGRHDLYAVVRGKEDGMSFRKISVTLGGS